VTVDVVLRTPFSPVNSEFNDFLYALVGDEGNGMTLSVISALTRLDIDPWQEAARLSDLSKEKAVQALAPIIARLPGGQWADADTPNIAVRLAGLLPHHDSPTPSGLAVSIGSGKPHYQAIFLVLYVVGSVAASLFMAAQRPSPPGNSVAPTETSRMDSRHSSRQEPREPISAASE
jgi:hypothetical protein